MKKIEYLKWCDSLYYNGEESPLSDTAYDLLKIEARREDPNNPYFLGVGAETKKSEKVQTPRLLGSLNKYKIDNIHKWLKGKKGKLFLSAKLDGSSVYVKYKNGQVQFACTRGNGRVGFDITHKVKKILPDIPEKDEIELRGEVLLKNPDLIHKYGYKNARNAASGIINRDDFEGVQDLKILFYELISPQFQTQSESYLFIQKYWERPLCSSVDIHSVDSSFLVQYLKEVKTNTFDDIDGLVICPEEYQYVEEYYPKDKVSFKVNEDAVRVIVDRVEMNVTRSGRLVPLVWFKEPVNINGSLIQKATGHNYQYLKTQKIGPDASVGIVKSGEIIPYIMEVYSEGKFRAPEKCPSCGMRSTIKKKGVDLVCINTECPAKMTKFLEYFFSTLGCEKISEKTFQNLGIRTLEQAFSLKEEDISGREGFGQRSANIIVSEIQKCLKTDHSTLLAGIGIDGIGKKNSKKLIQEFGTIQRVLTCTHEEFIGIPGFGEKLFQKLDRNKLVIEKVLNTLYRFGLQLDDELVQKNQGQKVAMTGKGPLPRKTLEAEIEKMGYISSDLNKECSILLTHDPDSGSSKMKKAQKWGILVLTYNQFFGE